jgi:hypothetical protein
MQLQTEQSRAGNDDDDDCLMIRLMVFSVCCSLLLVIHDPDDDHTTTATAVSHSPVTASGIIMCPSILPLASQLESMSSKSFFSFSFLSQGLHMHVMEICWRSEQRSETVKGIVWQQHPESSESVRGSQTGRISFFTLPHSFRRSLLMMLMQCWCTWIFFSCLKFQTRIFTLFVHEKGTAA